MAWLVYILRCSGGNLYTGITNDLEKRLKTHESGKGSKYVKSRRPFSLVFLERADDRSTAQKREAEIKGLSRREKLCLIRKAANRKP